jgi:UDP-glucose 4-epimerase
VALVTGATGFIGEQLCTKLVQLGCEVHGIARRESTHLPEAVRQWRCDVADIDEFSSVWKQTRPSVVFNLASTVTGSREMKLVVPALKANLVGAVHCFQLGVEMGCSRVVTTGSMEEPIASKDEVAGSPYAAAKLAASEYARMFHALYDFPVVNLRIFMVYGPGQRDKSKLVPHVVLSALKGHAPQISSGRRLIDWIYIDDVVDALVAAAIVPDVDGVVADIGSGTSLSVRAMVEEIVRATNPDVRAEFGAVADRPLERTRVADTQRSLDLIGWRPRVSLEEGVARTVEWYRAAVDHGDL